jgi:cell division protein FtsA
MICGIVITGGGALLKHLNQLVEFVTGIDCRIGYPNEHLSKFENMPKNVYEEMKSPMYSTSVGLLIKGIQKVEEEATAATPRKATVEQPVEKKKSLGILGGLLEKAKELVNDGMNVSNEDYTKP